MSDLTTAPAAELPLLTGDLPGIGGTWKQLADDFMVEEIPSYEPVGSGPHLFMWVEKRDVDSGDLVRRAAEAFSVPRSDVGMAGRKDRHAITRQWISVPWNKATPEAEGIDLGDGVRVLKADLHGNKLRTGHLRANRFTLRVRGVVENAEERAVRKLQQLARHGLPNFYGEQRFGGGDQQVARGRALLLGEGRRPRDKRMAKFWVSTFQAHLFNCYLCERMARGWFQRVLTGDVLKKAESGGIFQCEDAETDQARFDARELHVTGPIYGAKLRWATGEPGELEQAVLAEEGLDAAALAGARRLGPGTRRPLRVLPSEAWARREADDLLLGFILPTGAYATRLLTELGGHSPGS